MKSLNKYIIESWSGVKNRVNNAEIEAWCNEMKIHKYRINSKGEIDVNDNVYLDNNYFEELPYKFGTIKGFFSLENCKNLISLKNCPNYILGKYMFNVDGCSQLKSLEGCPIMVEGNFWCNDCKRTFTKEEILSLCKVKGDIFC